MIFDRNFYFRLGIFLICEVWIGVAGECRIIETKSGKVRGMKRTTLFRKMDFYSYKGIPYAKPPTGDLRFKVNNRQCSFKKSNLVK